jgi:hypothetical protein
MGLSDLVRRSTPTTRDDAGNQVLVMRQKSRRDALWQGPKPVLSLFLNEGFHYTPKLRNLRPSKSDDQFLGHNVVENELTQIFAKITPGVRAFLYIRRKSFEPSLRRNGPSQRKQNCLMFTELNGTPLPECF